MTTWTYLDLGVVRVREYLTRTPDVKGLRGASAWLSHATRTEQLNDWALELAGAGAQVNDEAGEADGVVPLRLPADADPERVAVTVMRGLRSRLPAAQFESWWGRGSTYLDVRAERSHWRPGPRDLAAPAEFPPLVTCQRCRIDPATARITLHENPYDVCSDCRTRYEEPYRQRELRKVDGTGIPVREERQLLTELEISPGRTAHTFEELAALGQPSGNRNHLATVFADGNSIGALFHRIAHDGSDSLKRTVSATISAATRHALQEASRAVHDDGRMPVIPHIVGGDDVVVTVVADRAWTFVTTYLDVFQDRMALLPELKGYPPVTASAGLVIAHSKFPFRRCFELAHELMRRAKNAHNGQSAAVAWVDVTRDGDLLDPSTVERVWTVARLHALTDALHDLGQVDGAGRAALERLIDRDTAAEVCLARLREHGRRLGRSSVLEPFLADGPTPESRVRRLAEALSLVRWWQ